MAKIKVKSGRTDNRVVLAEKHPDHPTGEVFIAGPFRNKLKDGRTVLKDGQAVQEPNVVEVAETPAVLGLLASGELIEVKSRAKAAPEKEDRNEG